MAANPLENPQPLIERVYAYVAYRVGPGPDAEDITSEVFERATRYRGTYDPRKGEPVAWLIGIARYCVNASGSRERPVGGAEELPDELVAGPEEQTISRLDLAAAVTTLGNRERELVALRYGADLTAKHIGEILGMRTNSVEVALHRALGQLRAALTSQGIGGGSPDLGRAPVLGSSDGDSSIVDRAP